MYNPIIKLFNASRYFFHYLIWRPRFEFFGFKSLLLSPILIKNSKFIKIGVGSLIRNGARLEVVLRPNVDIRPCLSIGDNVNIEQGAHIICQSRVLIEDDVSITPYCVIVDTEHPFQTPDDGVKIGSRLNDRVDVFVRIGRGTFVGAHSVILPGVDIGVGCVIGAGSVVTKSLPDYCLASGVPARVIRKFNLVTRTWEACGNEY